MYDVKGTSENWRSGNEKEAYNVNANGEETAQE